MDKLHVYTITWNENYMIRWFLRYYETVADHIFVIDDHSTDGTRELVLASPKCTLIDFPYDPGLDSEENSYLLGTEYRKYSRDAEWVITVDCDEFVKSDGNLREFLNAKRAEGRRAIKCTGIICASKDLPNTDGQLFDAMPYREHSRKYCKSIVFDPKLDVDFNGGCHPPTKFSDGVEAGQCGLYLYHCCYLSKKYGEDHLRIRLSRLKNKEDISDLNYYIFKMKRLYDRMVSR